MRIVAGTYGGRKLIVPNGRDIRPTSDKIRGAVMNMLISRGAIEGAHVLDAFCGSGALGLEAISRGAASCVFVDVARDSLDLAKENAKAFGVEATFLLKDATKIGSRPESLPPVDLVFLDPPYGKGLAVMALKALEEAVWFAQEVWCVMETEKAAQNLPEGFEAVTDRIFGGTRITILKGK